MIKYTYRKETIRDIDSIVCDKCGKIIHHKDIIEMQETHSIHFIGGYGSIFGDNNEVECDLCQECLYYMIKDFCRYPDIEESDSDEDDERDIFVDENSK